MPDKDILVEMNNVVSSNICAIGYNDEEKVLRVRFANGGLYQYTEVPRLVYDEFKKSNSVGRYFSAVIRGKFPFTKVIG